MFRPADWAGPDSSIGSTVREQSEACLGVYRQDPSRIEEDARIELAQAEGGYRRSQLFELLQNATDAMREQPGRISVVYTEHALYVANQGAPFNEPGVRTLLASHLSGKSEKDIGQFGLGFKSVLAVSDRPAVFSRSGSFAFDAAWSRRCIEAAGFKSTLYPVLRIGRAIDPGPAAEGDGVLSELMEWASTVVKLPLTCHKDERAGLRESLSTFPAAFMLFAPQVSELRLDDRAGGELRTIRAQRGDGLVELSDNQSRSKWFVSSVTHRLSPLALRDAGQLARRETIELSWAAPLDAGRWTLGEFWAYFPTRLRTTLAGIVNAPWKLNPDRTQMLDGMYNRELLVAVLPDLIKRSLPRLFSGDDPAAILDLLPARGRESRSFGDEILNEPVMATLAAAPSLPACGGTLQKPSALSLQPAGIQDAWRELWVPSRPAGWVHESVDVNKERRAKAERLIETGSGRTASLTTWIEACVEDPSPSASAAALRLAARIVRDEPQRQAEVRAAKIVLLEDGSLSTPIKGQVFLRSDASDSGHDFVHPDLLGQRGVRENLQDLGIEVLNPLGEVRNLLQRRPRGQDWGAVWARLADVEPDAALHVFREEISGDLSANVFARARSGKWRPLAMVFLPGEVIPANSQLDADFVVDAQFHAHHIALLERLGCVQAPRLQDGVEEPWVRAFKEKCAERYRTEAQGHRPALDKIVVSGPGLPWPLEPMAQLSPSARAGVTAAVLRLGPPQPWTVRHSTNSQFRTERVPNPIVPRLRRYAVLPTAIGLVEIDFALHPDASVPDCFPIAQVSTEWAGLLGLPKELSVWSDDVWTSYIDQNIQRLPERAAEVYVEAARNGVACPPSLLVQVSPSQRAKRRSETIAVTDDTEVLRSLSLAGIPALLVEGASNCELLTAKWALADGRDMLKEQVVATPDSDPVPLIDRFPPLRLYEAEIPDLEQLDLQTCSSIEVLVSTPQGQIARPSQHLRNGSLLLVRSGTDEQVLRAVGRVLQVPLNVRSVLDEMERQRTDARVAAVLREESLAAKLLAAVGADVLRQHVPGPALADLEGGGRELAPNQLAELVLAVHGFATLRELRSELMDAGFQPPTQWAGGSEARRFVAGLGFPTEYAGFSSTPLPASVSIEGQIFLPRLHPYQELVVGRIRDLMVTEHGPRRGMVTLPTGAGKTRVAVEAAVRLAGDRRLTGPVVWIAQTEELCEQAVQAWSYVWRAIGQGALEVSRFWAKRDVDQAEPGIFQVVVCTIDKLEHAVGARRYDWLVDPSLVVVDEAHTSVTPSYTRVLHWLTGTERFDMATTPLLGLTATPYRGHSESETKTLVNRYGGNKLDEGVFESEDPYEYLQKRRILATVRQEVLAGVEINLPEAARTLFQQTKRLPQSVEAEVGRDAGRNQRIIKSVLDQPESSTILLFASSVENASALAAELSYYGVPARPINSGTDAALRRRYVEQFRAGDVRVLTNYNVLAQGFDAPKVEAVYVTRPTFSPNLYQQMIGRGLRGPENGGSEEVLIVNVADNLAQYGEQLAFHHFDHLWSANDR